MSSLKIKILVPVYSSKNNTLTNISTESLLSIKDPYAVGLFVYLCCLGSQNENEVVFDKTLVRRKLNLSVKKLDEALSYLIKIPLIKIEN